MAYVCIFLMAMVMCQFSFGLFRLIEYDFRDELKVDEEHKVCSDSESSTRNLPEHEKVNNSSSCWCWADKSRTTQNGSNSDSDSIISQALPQID